MVVYTILDKLEYTVLNKSYYKLRSIIMPALLLTIFSKTTLRSYGPYIVLLLVVLGVVYKFYSMSSTIDSLRTTVHNLELQKTTLEYNIRIAEQSNRTLSTALDELNQHVSSLETSKTALQDELTKWKNQPPKEVVKIIEKVIKVKDHTSITLEECINVNKSISKLIYKEL